MSEHYTNATQSVSKWCDVCCRHTVHHVSGNRAGRCTEHEAPAESKRQQKARVRRERDAANPKLFE